MIRVLHTAAALFVNENESGLRKDIVRMLEGLVPSSKEYAHNSPGDANAVAHLRRLLLSSSLALTVSAGTLDLGLWERVFLAELDSPRQPTVMVKVLGE